MTSRLARTSTAIWSRYKIIVICVAVSLIGAGAVYGYATNGFKPAHEVREVVTTEVVPYSLESTKDSALDSSKKIVKQEGTTGLKQITTQYIYHYGRLLSSKVIDDVTTKQPVKRVEVVGTKVIGVDISNICPGQTSVSSCANSIVKNSKATGSSTNSGYDAGYSYAEQYNICDPDYSNGKSDSFNQGVLAWEADNCSN